MAFEVKEKGFILLDSAKFFLCRKVKLNRETKIKFVGLINNNV